MVGCDMASIVDILVVAHMIIIIVVVVVGVVVLISGMIRWHFTTALASTGTTPARGRIDTVEAFLDATATYGRGTIALEVLAAAFVAGQGRRPMRGCAWRRRTVHQICSRT